MTKRAMKVASFAPELIELFRRGVHEQVRIILLDSKQAARARQRMYDLRRSLRAEKHPLTDISERAQCRVEDNVLIVEPKDFDLGAALREHDITTDAVFDEESPGTPITDEQAHKALSDYLKE